MAPEENQPKYIKIKEDLPPEYEKIYHCLEELGKDSDEYFDCTKVTNELEIARSICSEALFYLSLLEFIDKVEIDGKPAYRIIKDVKEYKKPKREMDLGQMLRNRNELPPDTTRSHSGHSRHFL